MYTLYAYALDGRTEVEEVLLGQLRYLSHNSAEFVNLLMQQTYFLGLCKECHLLHTAAPQAAQAMVAQQLAYLSKAYLLLKMLWVYHAGLLLQVLLGIHGIPPCGVVLQPAGKPRHDAVVPSDTLVVVQDMVVLTLNGYEGRFLTQNFQGCKHLNTLVDGHISICSSMHEQDRCFNLVGIKEGSVTAVQLHIVPGV